MARRTAKVGKSTADAEGFACRPGTAGVRVVGTAIWCDTARSRAMCFVSRPDAQLGRGRADRIVTTERTASVRRALGLVCDGPLLARFGRPFLLGRARLELLPSGAMAGAAQLLVELPGWRGLYAGTVNPLALPDADPAQVRACDEVVLEAPTEGGLIDGLAGLTAALAARGDGPLLLSLTSLEALVPIVVHLGSERVALGPKLRRLRRLWPALRGTLTRREDADVVIEMGDAEEALPVSPGARVMRGLGLGLRPSAHDLDRWLADTGATRVSVRVGDSPLQEAGAALLVGLCKARGVAATAVAAPRQLVLFG